MIPLTVPEIRRLLAAFPLRPWPPGHAAHWPDWRRRQGSRGQPAGTGSGDGPCLSVRGRVG